MKTTREEICVGLNDRRDFPPAAKRVRVILENLNRLKCGSILDGGCGTGWVSSFLEEAGFRTVMLDSSQEMLERCLVLKSCGALSSPLVNATMTSLPFADGTFDLCIMLDVIEHVPNMSQCLREVDRVLSDRGSLFMTTPNKFGTYTILYDFAGKRIFGRRISDHIHFFSVEDLKKLLFNHGFLVHRVEKIEFMSPLLHMLSRNLRYGRRLVCRLSQMDVLLSAYLPTQLVSEWFVVASKGGNPRRVGGSD